jgi:hypothetical protein
MIILSNDIVEKKKINIKINQFYSDGYTFVPLLYDKEEIIMQTPKLYTQYGINNKYDKDFIDLSFRNIINDKSIENFKHNLDVIYLKIANKYKNTYKAINYLKYGDKDITMRLKVQDNLLIFDQNKNKLDKMITNTYGNFLINLQGFWIIENEIYFQWYLLQAKIDIPIYLENYCFVEEYPKIIKKPIPPPPPLPNFGKKKITTFKIIPKKKVVQKKEINVPSLNDIKNALNSLKSINNNIL